MPYKRDFVQANRYDLARVVERYGGLYELAEKLGFQARRGIHDTTVWPAGVLCRMCSAGLISEAPTPHCP